MFERRQPFRKVKRFERVSRQPELAQKWCLQCPRLHLFDLILIEDESLQRRTLAETIQRLESVTPEIEMLQPP